MVQRPIKRREASAAEFRALAHPLRMRILRLCLYDALTNKEIADRLESNPATVLHHVRMLVENGFLSAEKPRTGARGALEKPYRATKKSWTLSLDRQPADRQLSAVLAMVDSFRAELLAAGAERTLTFARIAPRLDEASQAEMRERLQALADEFNDRDDPGGTPCSLLIGSHLLGPPPEST